MYHLSHFKIPNGLTQKEEIWLNPCPSFLPIQIRCAPIFAPYHHNISYQLEKKGGEEEVEEEEGGEKEEVEEEEGEEEGGEKKAKRKKTCENNVYKQWRPIIQVGRNPPKEAATSQTPRQPRGNKYNPRNEKRAQHRRGKKPPIKSPIAAEEKVQFARTASALLILGQLLQQTQERIVFGVQVGHSRPEHACRRVEINADVLVVPHRHLLLDGQRLLHGRSRGLAVECGGNTKHRVVSVRIWVCRDGRGVCDGGTERVIDRHPLLAVAA